MGWASASEIFDPVAKALIDANADDALKRQVLGRLIGKLQDEDWDTEDESLNEFRDDLAVVQAFYDHGVGNVAEGDDADGTVGYDSTTDEWTLHCSRHGWIGRRPGTVEDHNALVREWAEHDRDEHDGTGEVADWMFIGTRDGA